MVLKNKLRYAYLSGLHPTLPLSELKSIHEAFNSWYQEIAVHEQLVLYKSSLDPRLVVERAGMIHEVGTVLDIVEADIRVLEKSLKTIVEDLRVSALRITRVKGVARHIETKLRELRGKLNLQSSGKTQIHVIVSEGIAVIGLVEAIQDKKALSMRRPHKRPFFRSVALDPRLARIFVNLSRPPPWGVYYDPFCGTGGFAIEAGLMGLQVLCSDIDPVMARGSLINVRTLLSPQSPHVCMHSDAVALPVRDESVDAIGTDPPYGRSASTKGRKTERLLRAFLEEAARVLRKGRYVAFASPHWLDIDNLVSEAGLYLVEKHYMRVHGSLTRIIAVARKV